MRRAFASATWTSADLRYDPNTHTSTLPDGTPVPHVTAVLSATGLSEDFDRLSGTAPRVAAAVQLARHRGTAVHADCHAFDDDDLQWATVDPRVRPYVLAWAEARGALWLHPLAHARERHVFHPLYRYTGILDGVFLRQAPNQPARHVLVHLKTGDPEAAAAHLQTAAYKAAWDAEHPDEPVDERWAIWLRPERAVPYTVENYTARLEQCLHDFPKFLAALTVYNEQPARRRRI